MGISKKLKAGLAIGIAALLALIGKLVLGVERVADKQIGSAIGKQIFRFEGRAAGVALKSWQSEAEARLIIQNLEGRVGNSGFRPLIQGGKQTPASSFRVRIPFLDERVSKLADVSFSQEQRLSQLKLKTPVPPIAVAEVCKEWESIRDLITGLQQSDAYSNLNEAIRRQEELDKKIKFLEAIYG